MARSLKLERYGMEVVGHRHLSLFRIRIDAVDPVDMDAEVFVFQRRPMSQYDDEILDVFVHVASAVDMTEYPADEPDDEAGVPFFRKSSVELDFRSLTTANETWDRITQRVETLISALNLADNLALEETYTAGETEEGESES